MIFNIWNHFYGKFWLNTVVHDSKKQIISIYCTWLYTQAQVMNKQTNKKKIYQDDDDDERMSIVIIIIIIIILYHFINFFSFLALLLTLVHSYSVKKNEKPVNELWLCVLHQWRWRRGKEKKKNTLPLLADHLIAFLFFCSLPTCASFYLQLRVSYRIIIKQS